ncbi:MULTISPECIES: glycerol-3-phosphate dehydrogenase/oxidase [unclassified Agrobacterium]|uniref:glycerol-3-phosphate dehydrogenase/oxidase n=1 Tax=unclassified Agrobacterium TaxID=2632611 RepID=UPI0024494B94|nr:MULTISPECIES: glycerol-3-phosphate dehydrogenase/oxidase [unclassified Agrobacterium]MDH0611903.1 glycerol-3-phosphate dehydrogenase/oxidase [Agrobacterium sp. GD03872]MDH0695800.1 glycerol-3-phosphate dehydrogenase/oxidase [Agrobacterium sp. GD03871]MDH1058926.1 glycerol-3-phosphate dehydrogenase/oxidase [Agrobacterium sp. GD03992]MDH2211017.1 glycerol-3-phosphate dehydrogenase/oxidase [Agrobacterium sp. GD03643]MDH2217566.1 glycerol-3-phosphate dehydrogenase/oxidase [Agrobacterium sp. GD0
MPSSREDALRRIRQDGDFDAIVIGGGINGIAAYRDLALQGLRVLLVERNDFSSGCSAAPSRMIHGGLRYLENGEFGLVAESLRERDALLTLAPHMVHPLPTTIPIFSMFSGLFNAAATFFGSGGKPASRGALAIKAGLTLYDFVTRKNRILPRHEFRSAGKTLQRWPGLTPAIRYSATYYDAWISQPERLALELLIDTSADAPQSIAMNYAEAIRTGEGYFLRVEEREETLPIRPRIIVNATGAWIDETIGALAAAPAGEKQKPTVSGTKGSHLIIANAALLKALNGHMIFFENADNRVCILFPYLGRVLAGSTDIKVDRPERVRCEQEERDYILEAVRQVFPDIVIDHSDIVFSFSGIRPLPRSDAAFTGRISRSHFIHRVDGDPPQLCMIGGKWTTFRAFGEQVSDEVLAFLGRRRLTGTMDRPIGGGRDFPTGAGRLASLLSQQFSIDRRRSEHLALAYGSRALELMGFCRARADDTPLSENVPITAAEVIWLIRAEHVRHLTDIVLRRTTLAITGVIDADLIDAILDVAARELAWSPARAAAEGQRLIHELETFYGVTPAMLQHRCKENA